MVLLLPSSFMKAVSCPRLDKISIYYRSVQQESPESDFSYFSSVSFNLPTTAPLVWYFYQRWSHLCRKQLSSCGESLLQCSASFTPQLLIARLVFLRVAKNLNLSFRRHLGERTFSVIPFCPPVKTLNLASHWMDSITNGKHREVEVTPWLNHFFSCLYFVCKRTRLLDKLIIATLSYTETDRRIVLNTFMTRRLSPPVIHTIELIKTCFPSSSAARFFTQ